MKQKITRRIALAELQTLFYSPIAWLVLIIFTVQVMLSFSGMIGNTVKSEALNYHLSDLTFNVLAGPFGLFPRILRYLHLYIPLLTMGLISKEISSGTIKLLYSSPVTNIQIIFGKFLAMVLYGLVLLLPVLVCLVVGSSVIENFDWIFAICAMLGFYLLILAYSAIGVFMSSLTSYQIVAAIATITLLSVFGYMSSVAQSVDFVREITYWLSINGRAELVIKGLLRSEDILYFLIVMALFLSLSILRLNAVRKESKAGKVWISYSFSLGVALILGYLSSRPTLMTYFDSTRTKQQSLTLGSQEIVKQLEGGLTMTTYVNVFDDNAFYAMPSQRKSDIKRFEQFIRFKPDLKLRYVYYYAQVPGVDITQGGRVTEKEHLEKIIKNEDGLSSSKILTLDEVNKEVDLKPEGYHLVRVLKRANGAKEFLRMFGDSEKYPTEREISAALKRLVVKNPPTVGFLQGHGERNFSLKGDRSYNLFAANKLFRYALINQGFNFSGVRLDREVPGDISILIIAEMKTAMSGAEKTHLDAFIARGGNLLILADVRRQKTMNPVLADFGVSLLPGQLLQLSKEDYKPDFIVAHASPEAATLSPYLEGDTLFNITMPGAVGLTYAKGFGYEVQLLLMSRTTSWNELDSVDLISRSAGLGSDKVKKAHPTALALSRKVGKKNQKIMILGDADCISDGEITHERPNLPAANFNLILGAFNWMSNGSLPIDITRPEPIDNTLKIDRQDFKLIKFGLIWAIPLSLIVGYLILWLRRRGR